MPMSIEIPSELQSFVQGQLASGKFANEQELVIHLLRVLEQTKEGYDAMRAGVQRSLEQADRGEISKLDFDAIEQRLCDEFDEASNRK